MSSKEYMKSWIEENRDKVREHDKNWKLNNPEKLKESRHKYYLSHKERFVRSPEKNAEACKKYRESHPDSLRDWEKKNPEKRIEITRRRRSRKKNVLGGHFTEREWQALLDHYGRKCLCCGTPESEKSLERDHVIPLSKPRTSDEISNIQPLCRNCNIKKGTKSTDYRKGVR